MKTRILVENARYQIVARMSQMTSLRDAAEAKLMFLKVMAEAEIRFSCRIENFLLVCPHFYFILKPGSGGSLAVVMKWILQTFSSRYNRSKGLCGRFWRSRFISAVLPDDEEDSFNREGLTGT